MISSASTFGFSYGLNYSLVLFLLSLEDSFNTPLILFVRQVCSLQILLVFVYLGMSLCFLHFCKIILLDVVFLANGFFFLKYLNYVIKCFLDYLFLIRSKL